MTHKLIIFYKGLHHEDYLYPLNKLCPGTYYFVEHDSYMGGCSIYLPHEGYPSIYMDNDTWEEEFL